MVIYIYTKLFLSDLCIFRKGVRFIQNFNKKYFYKRFKYNKQLR